TPTDLLICAGSTAAGFNAATPTCGTAANIVTNQTVVAAVVWSQGKNWATMPAGNVDEQVNNKQRLPAPLNNNPTFVWHDRRRVRRPAAVDPGLAVLRPADLGRRAALSRRSRQRKADLAFAVRFQRQAVAARLGLARRLVEPDAQAAARADWRAQHLRRDFARHRRATVADAQREALVPLERHAYAQALVVGTLGERVADQVVGHAVEQRARQTHPRRR